MSATTRPATDPTLMVCWACGYRGVLRSVNGALVVVHGPGWICAGAW